MRIFLKFDKHKCRTPANGCSLIIQYGVVLDQLQLMKQLSEGVL